MSAVRRPVPPPSDPIGGSEAAAIVGVSPYASGFDIWTERIHRDIPQDELNDEMRWGQYHEPNILTEYERVRKAELFRHPPMLADEGVPEWVGGHPDAVVSRYLDVALQPEELGKGIVVESKSSDSGIGFGDEGTDQVPLGHLVQGQWYLFGLGFQRVDFPVLVRGNRVKYFTAERDPELIELLVNKVGEFREQYLLRGNRPPIEFTERAAAFVRKLYPSHREGIREATEGEAALMREWLDRKRTREDAAKVEDLAKLPLQYAIADSEGLKSKEMTVTYRKAAGSREVDWEQVARWLGQAVKYDPAQFRELVETYTTIKPGSRRLLVREAE